jgi:hypothetical protein
MLVRGPKPCVARRLVIVNSPEPAPKWRDYRHPDGEIATARFQFRKLRGMTCQPARNRECRGDENGEHDGECCWPKALQWETWARRNRPSMLANTE